MPLLLELCSEDQQLQHHQGDGQKRWLMSPAPNVVNLYPHYSLRSTTLARRVAFHLHLKGLSASESLLICLLTHSEYEDWYLSLTWYLVKKPQMWTLFEFIFSRNIYSSNALYTIGQFITIPSSNLYTLIAIRHMSSICCSCPAHIFAESQPPSASTCVSLPESTLLWQTNCTGELHHLYT